MVLTPDAPQPKEAVLIGLCEHVKSSLETTTLPSALLEDIQRVLAVPFPKSCSDPNVLDELATHVWNAAARLHRDEKIDKRALSILRTLVVYIFDVTLPHGIDVAKVKADKLVRFCRTAHKAADTCMDTKQLALCSNVLQKCAERIPETHTEQESTNEHSEQQKTFNQMSVEYWLLRTRLSWLQGNHDVAEYMFGKVTDKSGKNPPTKTQEKIADMTFEIGTELLSQKKYTDAVRWLDRSSSVLDVRIVLYTMRNDKLRCSAYCHLARALLGIGDDASQKRVSEILDIKNLQRMTSCRCHHSIRLDLIACASPFPSAQYAAAIRESLRWDHRLDTETIFALSHLKVLASHDMKLAQEELDTLLRRDSGMILRPWKKELFLFRLWILVTGPADEASLHSVTSLLNIWLHNKTFHFDPDSTNAVHALIYKAVETGSNRSIGALWAKLAHHPFLHVTGLRNGLKIACKHMQLCLEQSDFEEAYKTFKDLPRPLQSEISACRLLYKTALYKNDVELANQALVVISMDVNVTEHLLACMDEARQLHEWSFITHALENVLCKRLDACPESVRPYKVLRHAIKLLIDATSDTKTDVEILFDTLYESFGEEALGLGYYLKEWQSPDKDHEWLYSQLYSAITGCRERLKPGTLLMALEMLIDLIIYPRQSTSDRPLRLVETLGSCLLLSVSTAMDIARAENGEESEFAYSEVCRKATRFHNSIQTPDISRSDKLAGQRHEIVKYELEALFKRKAWDKLMMAVEVWVNTETPVDFTALADLIIQMHTHYAPQWWTLRFNGRVLGVIQKIVNHSWRGKRPEGHYDMTKLARWIRCVYRMFQDTCDFVIELLLDEVIAIVATSSSRSSTDVYPPEELEWLACTHFNKSIDVYFSSDGDRYMDWIEKAFKLAWAMDDDGVLHRAMQSRWSKICGLEKELRPRD